MVVFKGVDFDIRSVPYPGEKIPKDFPRLATLVARIQKLG